MKTIFLMVMLGWMCQTSSARKASSAINLTESHRNSNNRNKTFGSLNYDFNNYQNIKIDGVINGDNEDWFRAIDPIVYHHHFKNPITKHGIRHSDRLFRSIEMSSRASGNFIWPIKKEAVVEGDLVLGGLMMVHERKDNVTCGPVMPQGGVQALEAMLYTLDWVDRRKIVPGVKIGAHILDDCDQDTYGLEMAVDFIKDVTYGREGSKAILGQFQYSAAIWYRGVLICGGAIVTNRQIVTAGHCLHRMTIRDLRVVVGIVTLNENNNVQWHEVKSIDVPTGYELIRLSDPAGTKVIINDIGVLTLLDPLEFSSAIGPISFSRSLTPTDGGSCKLLLYKYAETRSIHRTNVELRWVPVTVIDYDQCKVHYPFLLPKQKCLANSAHFHGSRHGDSGAPIICDGELFGILHGGRTHEVAPAIILPVSSYAEFITGVINDRFENEIIPWNIV